MSKRQKYIASCCNPTYNGFATRDEVKICKEMAKGKFWVEDLNFGICPESEDKDTFVAFSPTGRREYFLFVFSSNASSEQKKKWKSVARKAAKAWCQGQYKKANSLYDALLASQDTSYKGLEDCTDCIDDNFLD